MYGSPLEVLRPLSISEGPFRLQSARNPTPNPESAYVSAGGFKLGLQSHLLGNWQDGSPKILRFGVALMGGLKTQVFECVANRVYKGLGFRVGGRVKARLIFSAVSCCMGIAFGTGSPERYP